MRRRVLTVRRYARVDKMYAYLLNSTHHGFPVVEHETQVMERLRARSTISLERDGGDEEQDLTGFEEETAEGLEEGSGPGDDGGGAVEDLGRTIIRTKSRTRSSSTPARPSLTFDDDLMMHSLNAGSLRDDEEYHVLAADIFKAPAAAGERAGAGASASRKRRGSGASAAQPGRGHGGGSPRSPTAFAPPEEWHSPVPPSPRKRASSFNQSSRRGSAASIGSAHSVHSIAPSIDPRSGNPMHSHFVGMVTRAQLIHALATREKHPNVERAHLAAAIEGAAEHAKRLREQFCAAALHDQGLRELELTSLDIQPHHHEMLIDLGPYIDDGVLSVAPNTPLGRVHRLFVSCGMRHLVVTDKDNEVSGIITRKDLTMQRKAVAFPQERPLVPTALARALARCSSKGSDSAGTIRRQLADNKE